MERARGRRAFRAAGMLALAFSLEAAAPAPTLTVQSLDQLAQPLPLPFHFDRNLDIPAHYGLHDRLKGVPSVLIVDSRTDRLVNVDRTAALSDARHLTPQRCPTG